MRRSNLLWILLVGSMLLVGLIDASASASGGRAYVVCEGSNSPFRPYLAQHPTNCNVMGQPPSTANLLRLRNARWTGWGEEQSSAVGRFLFNHGHGSGSVIVRLYRLRRACGGRLIYTREESLTPYIHHAQVHRLQTTCP